MGTSDPKPNESQCSSSRSIRIMTPCGDSCLASLSAFLAVFESNFPVDSSFLFSGRFPSHTARLSTVGDAACWYIERALVYSSSLFRTCRFCRTETSETELSATKAAAAPTAMRVPPSSTHSRRCVTPPSERSLL